MNGIIIISSKIGTPIWSREYFPSFGLGKSSSSGGLQQLVESEMNHHGIRDGAQGVVGDASSLVGKTQHISEMSVSGLLYALKLNSEMCFKETDHGNEEEAIQVDRQDSLVSKEPIHSNGNELLLKSFTFDNCILCFHEEFSSDLFCVGFFRKSFLMTSVVESLECEDQEVEFGHKITKAICDKFCILYGKKLTGSVRKSYKGFIPHLCAIYRHVVTDILEQTISDCMSYELQIEWIYACYDSTSKLIMPNETLMPPHNVNTSEKTQKSKKKKSVAINPQNLSDPSYMSRIGPMQWIVSNNAISKNLNHSQIYPLINQALTSYSNSLKILGQVEPCSESQMIKVRLTKSDISMSHSNTEYYVFRKSSTFLCFSLHSNMLDSNMQYIIQAHLDRLDSFLQSVQPDLVLSNSQSISNILN
ncbi:hypothetical protein FDP41_006445 [Naegleria fowleri]|uniref:Uncharacterized protein n=1 Tax=Naegleria fowleri TaxID=5763 RepID=A0A6A5B7P9_NAEFO|nr:uncharacterized protein FDP41_006445 [Naegleria fowleri]KAF0974413.1 hypothetical protein FDP41_006445 [Naegleria fowleri]